MSPRSKREYVEAVFLRYKRSSRKTKTRILDEFCATCGYHRKYAIQLLRGFKRFAKPQEIADAIMFFASSRSDYVTGQVMSVSGGLTFAG